MITLQDIFLDLEDGELNQFSLTGEIDGPKGIIPETYPTIIRAINLGLTDLHTKLVLKEREVTINLFEGMTFYELDSRYSIHNVTDREHTPKFIQDAPDYRFKDDIIQIRDVYNECGERLPINDSNSEDSVFLTSYKTIQYCGNTGDAILVTYQANHPRLSLEGDVLSQEVDIPEYMRELLYAFVMNRVLMRSQSPEAVGVANAYKMKYDTMINDIKRLNSLSNQDNTQATKLEARGWV